MLLLQLDNAWTNVVANSKLVSLCSKITSQLISLIGQSPSTKPIGKCLTFVSLGLVMALFVCIGLPQFTNDKQGLAIILITAFVFWIVGKLMTGSISYKGSFVDPLMILFFCINILATFSSHYFGASFHGLLKLCVYLLAYFLFCAQIKENSKNQFIFVGILLIGGALLSLDGLYQYKIGVAPLATWEDPTIENQATRIYATFNNPNLFAGYLVPLIMLAAAFIFACWQQSKWLLSFLPILFTSLLTTALILTGSRGGYLGLLTGFVLLITLGVITLWQQNKKMRPFLLLLLVCLPLILFAILHRVPGLEHRITSIFAGREHSSNSFRLNVWISSLKMFADNWLIGVGVGNQAFRLAYGLYMRSGFDALGTYCVPLEIAVETGVFGLITFGLIVIALLGRAHAAFWLSANKLQAPSYIYVKWLTAGAAVALIALLAHGLVDTVFFRPQVEFIFFLLIALIIGNSST